jgi:CzcA family heavy metal efflux pump
MWNAIIRWSLANRLFVVGAAVGLVIYGSWVGARMPVDVLPDLTAPTVTVLTEAHGMAPDEVERAVTVPLEAALNGAPGLRRLRSASGVGISIVWAEFDWDTEPFTARQIVSERLQVAVARLPRDVPPPAMAPMASIMGEIMFVGLVGGADPMAARDVAELQVRRRLLALPGIAQVATIGGALRQYQVVLRPESLRSLRLGTQQVVEALEGTSRNAPGGLYVSGHHEYLIRGVGRPRTLDELGQIVVARRGDQPILLRQVADVRVGAALTRGTAAIDGESAVVLSIQKQPGADTLALTAQLDDALDELSASMPDGLTLYREGFRQARFIDVALTNVTTHLVESAVLVVILLALFLLDARTTFISLVALPLSVLAGIVALHLTGAGINTMTLGGLAIAIGALVDDAIIDVENVHRRLRQRAGLPESERAPLLRTIFEASAEIRGSIVYATAIVVVVFLPLFFLSGLEGRLMQPLGIAYVVSISASLVVAVTITPALCAILLRDVPPASRRRDSPIVRALSGVYRPTLAVALRWPRTVLALSALGVLGSVLLIGSFGRGFLPQFNEGSFTIAAATVPGASLETSDALAGRLDDALGELDLVQSVVRRTGRAERDEHAQDVQFSELEVTVDPEVPVAEAAARLREAAAAVPGLVVSVGQPIGHRIEHMLSGVKTALAIKVQGPDLHTLRRVALDVRTAVADIPGLVDLAVEPQTDIPQLVVRPDFPALARLGLTPGDLAETTEIAFLGHPVGEWWYRGYPYDLVVRYPEHWAADAGSIARTPLDGDGERFATLGEVAHLDRTLGPNLINRENAQRRIVVMANLAGGDARGVVEQVRTRIRDAVALPEGYDITYGGEFESEARASRTIATLSAVAGVVMLLLMWMAFRSGRDAVLVALSLLLSLIGGALVVAATGGVLSVPSLLGFITLFGIAARNGIMLVSHYRHLVEVEGATVDEAIRRGSAERLIPILMTALGTGLALVPIALSLGQPGNEIQAPMALVILGGLSSSTLLTMVTLPVLYDRFGSLRRGRTP